MMTDDADDGAKRRGKMTRKNIYFAGHMEIDFENKEMSNLARDYRCCIVDSERILMPFDPIPLNDEYAYGWPSFYYADENGEPSLSSSLILEREFAIIPTIDVFVAYLGKEATAGTLGEVMYAAQCGKEMHIYYEPSATESDLYNTNQWYAIGMAEKINPGRVFATEAHGIADLLDKLHDDFGIEAIIRPDVVGGADGTDGTDGTASTDDADGADGLR